MRPESRPSQGESRPPGRRPDALLAVCVVALLAFPFAARFAASRETGELPHASAIAIPADAQPGRALRDLPAFTGHLAAAAAPRDGRAADLSALRRALSDAVAAVFAGRDRATMRRVIARGTLAARPGYPYRYPALEPLLDRAGLRSPSPTRAAAANDLGALLVLAAPRDDDEDADPAFAQAAPVAFALFDRARRGSACVPQLNLAFLLATDSSAHATEDELRRAGRECGDDATPLWVLAQLRSRQVAAGEIAASAARNVFDELQRRYPRSHAGWAAAGDDELRTAYAQGDGRPFTARYYFSRARDLYTRALARGPRDAGLLAAIARADAGLSRVAEAAAAQRAAVRALPAPAPLQARLVENLERAHDFDAAARAALAVMRGAFPAGPALYAAPDVEIPDAVSSEEADGPLSLGAGRLLPVSLRWTPRHPGNVGGGASAGIAVSDFSLIPEFRAVAGVTGTDRWCPAWSRRRDLVLSGRPREALRGMPAAFGDVRPDHPGECEHVDADGVANLRAVAELEAHPRRHDARAVRFQEAHQDLWRSAGDLPRARVVAEAWARAAPRDPVPVDRAGEISFLAKRYDEAARLFARAVRLARARTGTWSLDEAEALAKRGTALELGGRYDEAIATLADADEVATRIAGLRRDTGGRDRAALLAYSARAQAADTFLRMHRFAAADEQYAAAREEEPRLRDCDCAPGLRPEVLDNNQALVAFRLGHHAYALRAARRAVAADPLSPVFLQTLGVAASQTGERDLAVRAYRRALASDPGLFPAANELGIALASDARYAEAADAFRAAVSARPDYAAGWFNLGAALERQGLAHALGSQGSFAQAFELDNGLRDREHRFISDARRLAGGPSKRARLHNEPYRASIWARHASERRRGRRVGGTPANLGADH